MGLTTIKGSLALISRRQELCVNWIWVWRDAPWSVAFKMNTDELYVIGALQLQPQLTSNGDLLLNTYFQQLDVLLIPRRGCHQSRVVESMLLQLYVKFY